MLRACLTAALLSATLAGAALADDAAEEVEATMRAYAEAWSDHDGAAVAAFYHEPAMRVSPAGPVVRETQADQEAFFTGFLPGLVERGYATSAWEVLNVHLLDERTAIASGVTERRRGDGSLFERLAVTYGLWRTDEGWRIFFSATHEPESVVR